MMLFSAWGPPAQKYVCEICVVEVPCYDTLVKHKRGKEHIKREKDLEACFQTINLGINWHPSQERRKRDGLSLGDHAWAESKKPVGQFKGFQASCETLHCQISCFSAIFTLS